MALPKSKLPQIPTQSSQPLPNIELPQNSNIPLPPINNGLGEDFTQVDSTEDNYYQNIQYENQQGLPQQPVNEYEKPNHLLSDNPFEENKEKEEEYIDYKKKKIKPIGGNKSKVKDKDLDDRKNKLNMISML